MSALEGFCGEETFFLNKYRASLEVKLSQSIIEVNFLTNLFNQLISRIFNVLYPLPVNLQISLKCFMFLKKTLVKIKKKLRLFPSEDATVFKRVYKTENDKRLVYLTQ